MRLFLFDVDGTLVTAHGAGRRALAEALRAVYGATGPIDAYDFRGKTDPRIVLDLMDAAGVPAGVVRDGLAECWRVYVQTLSSLLADGSRLEVMPGIAELVRRLAERSDVVVGLLTGNIEAGARVKLGGTGLLPLFVVGAYGSDDADRRRLPAIACGRARARTGWAFPFDRVVIIGDTPLDVECARSCGARVVAVATGQHSLAELERCQPDLLLADFSDVDAAVAALTAAPPG